MFWRRFYAPQVFSTFGSGRKAALLNTVIIGAGRILHSPQYMCFNRAMAVASYLLGRPLECFCSECDGNIGRYHWS